MRPVSRVVPTFYGLIIMRLSCGGRARGRRRVLWPSAAGARPLRQKITHSRPPCQGLPGPTEKKCKRGECSGLLKINWRHRGLLSPFSTTFVVSNHTMNIFMYANFSQVRKPVTQASAHAAGVCSQPNRVQVSTDCESIFFERP